MGLKGKLALVTGGSRGIGREIARQLAKEGAHVIICALHLDGAEETADSICSEGGSASALRMDVTQREEVGKTFRLIAEKYKLLDILINNAGITRDGLLVRMKEDDWDSVLNTNLKGCFLCTQLAAKHMLKQKQGAIVNITSVVGLTGNPGQANYSAAKAGLIGLTKTAAREVASRGIRVNAVAPGFIETEMTRRLDDKVKEALLQKIPLARFGLPQDVADCVAFLVSDRARYITGQVINVNGGMLM